MSATAKPGERSDFVEKSIEGLSLLIIVSYAPFSIAALLAERHASVPLGFLLAMVFLSMAVGTLLSAQKTGTGLVLAPAVGMAIIASETPISTITTVQFLWAAFIAGLIAQWLSQPGPKGAPSLRQQFLNSLPRPVTAGVRGGVGALLASVAVHEVQKVASIRGELFRSVVLMFVVGVAVLLVSELYQSKFKRGEIPRGGLVVATSAYFLVPLAILVVLFSNHAFPLPALTWPMSLPAHYWLFELPITESDVLPQFLVLGSFVLLILFIFITDIPGSVYDLFKQSGVDDADVQRRIDESFRVTSTMSWLNPPVFGMFTSVYYAENYVVVRDGEAPRILYDPWVARFCGVIFLLCAVVFLFVQFPVSEMKTWLLVAVSPALFCLGIRITARAMQRDFLEELEAEKKKREVMAAQKKEGETVPASSGNSIVAFFVPSALTLTLTHFIGFELALPIGIVYYGLFVWFSGDERGAEHGTNFVVLFFVAALVVLMLAIVRIGGAGKHERRGADTACVEKGPVLSCDQTTARLNTSRAGDVI
jgi:uncharacterized protein YacL